jgi:hypothetical protein
MPDAEYRAIPAVSQSTLKAFADCPRKFKLAPKREATPNMIYGALVDALWLSGDMSRFALMPGGLDGRTNAGKAWKAANADKDVVSFDMHAMAAEAVRRLDSTPEITEARAACDAQVAVVAEIEGVMCKGLIDLCPKDGLRNGLADIKTAASADPSNWSRYVFTMRLHWQAALYLDLWNRASGEDLQEFFHIVSEQEPPHEPAMLALHHDFITLGRDEYRRALRRYNDCQTKDEWPGYEPMAVIAPEKWMLRAA